MTDFNNLLETVHREGRRIVANADIDGTLIRRGYVYLQTRIECEEMVFGKDSYVLLIEGHKKIDELERQRTIESDIIRNIETMSDSARISELILSARLSSHFKRDLLRRFAPDALAIITASIEDQLRLARERETTILCTLCPPSESLPLRGPLLLGTTTEQHHAFVRQRKQSSNELMKQVFGRLGFESGARAKGLYKLNKGLRHGFAVEVSVDAEGIDHRISPSLRIAARVLHGDTTVAGALLGAVHSYAFSLYQDIPSTSALEVAVRANAVMYEVQIQPIEALVNEWR